MSIIPMRDLKNTVEVERRCAEENGPVYVTKNGYGRLVVMDIEYYERTMQKMAEAKAVLDGLGAARVPAGKVYTAKDISEDPHYRARGMLLKQTTRDGYEVEVPGIVPKLSATPGRVRSSAPHLGDDTDAVLAEAGLTPEQIALLRSKGVIQ